MVLYLGSFILEKSVLQKFVGFVFFLTKNLNFHTINLITKSHAYLIFTRPTKLSHIINGYTRTALPYLSVLYQWVAGSGSAVTYVRKKEKKKKVLKAQIHREPCLMSTNFTFHCPARSPKFAVFLSYSCKYPVLVRRRARHVAVGFTRAKSQAERCRENAEIRDVSELPSPPLLLWDLASYKRKICISEVPQPLQLLLGYE